MNILVIAPHPDDESIGCGGTLRKHVLGGDRVSAVFLTSGELGLKHLAKEKAWEVREAEARNAAAILGIPQTSFLRGPDWALGDTLKPLAQQLQPILESQPWSLIYLPHPAEWHPDHKACLPLLQCVLAGVSKDAPLLRGYEVWTPLTEYQHVEDITRVMRVKLRAIRAHQSQAAQFDYCRATLGLNAYRGVMAGRCRYAEVFQQLVCE
jgi:LmbE family N-acetylglucosaminyl deacetylase